MPDIRPFCGLRYSSKRFGNDLSQLIAPPYDVLSAEDKAELLKGHDQNIVAVDLPHVPPKSAGPDEVYAQAAQQLQQWIDEQILIKDIKPAIYVYHQEYTFGGKQFTRRKFFARMRLEEFGTGTVFPHEQTFGGPKEDRLKLMQATRCQLSAIFALYSDPDNAVSTAMDIVDYPADVTAEMGGVTNRLWVVDDPATIRVMQRVMRDRAVYIADGHHRYGTAMMYRDGLMEKAGELPMDHPARFILVGLCAMEDPGCVILPTHRVLSGFGNVSPLEILKALETGVEITPLSKGPNDFKGMLPVSQDPYDLAIYVADEDCFYLCKFTQREILKKIAPQQSPAWRNLDLAYLHRYLIDELVTNNALGGKAPSVHCVKSAEDTIRLAREKKGIAVMCKACTMADLRGVSEAGDLMPQKSTFFYPKLATGLVINPLE